VELFQQLKQRAKYGFEYCVRVSTILSSRSNVIDSVTYRTLCLKSRHLLVTVLSIILRSVCRKFNRLPTVKNFENRFKI